MDSNLSQENKNLDPLVQEWLIKFKNNEFGIIDIRNFWKETIPKIFSIPFKHDSLKHSFDNNEIKTLFDKLEQFICASSNTENVLNELKTKNNKSRFCGKIFKPSEPIYNCRDCGVDSACVRCVDCFKNSSHKNHKYKITISNGGGFCDCGDIEAWKCDPFCDIHEKPAENDQQNLDIISNLNPELRKRFEIVVKSIINYCYELLCWENNFELPNDLDSNLIEDTKYHAVVLFNDEIHTFEQVISALTRTIYCDKKIAKDFASFIDREGRAIIYVTDFEDCKKIKISIERITGRSGKALKCEIIKLNILAHQEHALHLLNWLNKMMFYSEGFRLIFGKAMQSNVISILDNKKIVHQNVNILESVLLNDTSLWKNARNLWYKLFINGMFMDLESKKFFAKSFTKLYDQLIQEFMNDNHETNYSITNLSIQFYSVPSLSHLIIQENDALYVIAHCFYKECQKHLVDGEDGKLLIKRDQQNVFKRSQNVLNDLKYLLGVVPYEWNTELKKSFLHGFEIIIIILKWMQNMDSIIRQVGQHLEYEPDWETGIQLQLRISNVISLLFEWCSSDFSVLKKAVNISLNHLKKKTGSFNYIDWTFCNITCKCIDYDVSSLSVTIHLPLSRVVSGLLLELSKHNVDYNSIESPLSPVELMELPLRTLVMISQFRAGMWRRNGYSLVNQVIFYHGATFRDEMYDKDIIMLQYVASLIKPDEFLIHLLNKFSLMFWARDDFEIKKIEEDIIRQTVTLVEEFLNLLLIIVSERFTPEIGKVTPEQKIKREIIQWLCIEPLTHSDLIKNFSKLSFSVPIEYLINEVAVFKKNKDNQTGKYELKEEFYNEFNPFFYHYTRPNQCSAEESQLKRKKQNKETLITCPPPVPPEFTDTFKPLVEILNCKVFMQLVKIILERVIDNNSRSFSENQYEKILHLIGVALHEENRCIEQNIEKSKFYNFTKNAKEIEILKLLEKCLHCPKVSLHQDLTKWVIQKFNNTVENPKESLKEVNNEDNLVMTISSDNSNSTNNQPKRNSAMAAKLRQKIMAQMSAMQDKFIEDNSEYFQNKNNEELGQTSNNESSSSNLVFVNSDPIAIGNEQRGKFTVFEPLFCMLCREKEDITSSTTCMVLAAFAQRSTVLSKNRNRKAEDYFNRQSSFSSEKIPLTLPADLHCGTHVSTCGHVMHLECWKNFFASVVYKERRRPIRFGQHGSFNVNNNEYLCPLCECLSNTVIPIIPTTFYRNFLRNSKSNLAKITINDWISVMLEMISNSKQYTVQDDKTDDILSKKIKINSLENVLKNLKLDEETVNSFNLIQKIYTENAEKEKNFDPKLIKSFEKLSKAISSVEQLTKNVFSVNSNRELLSSFWACSYTIQSLERQLRKENKPTFADLSSRKHSCLQVLIRYCSVFSIINDIDSIRNHYIELLQYILVTEKHNLDFNSILDVDAFSILVSLILSGSSIYIEENDELKEKSTSYLTLPLGNVIDQYQVQLILLFHIVQIILTQSEFYKQTPMEVDESNRDLKNVENKSIALFYVDILKAAGIKSPFNNINNVTNALADKIAVMLKSKLLPFLRCTAMFYHFLTEIMPPQKLMESFSEDEFTSIEDLEEKEFIILSDYLALPKKLSELLSNVTLTKLAQSWARHPRVNLVFEQNEIIAKTCCSTDSFIDFKLVKQPHMPNSLIDLPEDYTELINNIASFPCPNSDSDDARCPTLCLICGKMLCSSSFSCQIEINQENYGACSYHKFECGAGVGIFLRTRDCKVLLLASKYKGCFLPAPYVDEYGETDQGLRRGNPLRLCRASYNRLSLLWLKHGLQEQIARIMETSSNIETTDWLYY